MQPAKVDLPDHTHGDTWEGLSIGPVQFSDGGDPPVLSDPPEALVSCRLYLRDSRDRVGYKLKTSPGSGEGTITIDNATTWLISVPAQDLPLDVGPWSWDFETVDAAGTVRTLYKGVLTITREQTRDS